MNTTTQPLLETIEPDEVAEAPPSRSPNPPAAPVVLTPGARSNAQMASSAGDAEAGALHILWSRQKTEPLPLQALRAYFAKSVRRYFVTTTTYRSFHPVSTPGGVALSVLL